MNSRYVESHEVTQFIGHEAIAQPALVKHYDVPVETDSESHDGVQTIHVAVADVDSPKGVLIVPVSWSDYGKRPFHEIRLGAMARYGQLRVVGLDFPGMGDLDGGRGDELTEKQKEQIHQGRLTDLASNYWQALDSFGDLFTDADRGELPISLWGNSLSTLTVAELAATLPDGKHISDLYTSEIMALSKTSFASLAKAFPTRGAVDLARYQKMNTGIAPHESGGVIGLVKQMIRQRESHIAAVKALSMGRHFTVITEAYSNGGLSLDDNVTQHIVIRAENGLMSPEDFDVLYMRLMGRSAGFLLVDARTLAGEYHGYQDALPAVLAQMGHLSIIGAH